MNRVRVIQVTAVAGAIVLALVLAGRFVRGGTAGPGPGDPGSAGSQLYATPGGVVWSFSPGPRHGEVARSTDGGRTWHVVLPDPGSHQGPGLAGSFFLGPDLGWVVYHQLRGAGSARGPSQTTTILGTTDGGRHWWRGESLPATPFGQYLSYEPYFTDARHGWLYGMAWTAPGDLVWQVVERLWRTSDGGRTWTLVRGHLPLQGTVDNGDAMCPDEGPFLVAFASQRDGWLTAGSCASIGSAPRVWRTTDGGATWSPVTLAAPPQGWPAASETYDGVPVGMPRIVGSELLVAVGDRYFRPSLDIEASFDGGRSWHLASRVSFPVPIFASPSTFRPVDASHWVADAPGGLMWTSDAGRTWRAAGRRSPVTGEPFWFTSPVRGYARAADGTVLTTADGGRTWTAAS